MQGMLSNAIGFDEVRKQALESGIDNLINLIAGAAADYATALVEKQKSENNGQQEDKEQQAESRYSFGNTPTGDETNEFDHIG